MLSLALPPKPPAVTTTVKLSPQHPLPSQPPAASHPTSPQEPIPAMKIGSTAVSLSLAARDRLMSLGIYKPRKSFLHTEASFKTATAPPAPATLTAQPAPETISAPAPAPLASLELSGNSGEKTALVNRDNQADLAQQEILSNAEKVADELENLREQQEYGNKLMAEVKLMLAHVGETQRKQQTELSTLTTAVQKLQDQRCQQQADANAGGGRNVSGNRHNSWHDSRLPEGRNDDQNGRRPNNNDDGRHYQMQAKKRTGIAGNWRRRNRNRSPTPEVKQEYPPTWARRDVYYPPDRAYR